MAEEECRQVPPPLISLNRGRSAACHRSAFDTDGEIVGIITVEPYDDRIPVLRNIYDPGRTAELFRCCVDKRCRRAGIGSLLFKEAQRFCLMNGYQVLYLHTHRFLPGALEFWQSRGFAVRIGAGDEHGTLHMGKSLNSNKG